MVGGRSLGEPTYATSSTRATAAPKRSRGSEIGLWSSVSTNQLNGPPAKTKALPGTNIAARYGAPTRMRVPSVSTDAPKI
ncbi:MAG: hypothetical protein R3F34_04285 [Planctomycetota bacterium]